jgi:hypothetical protein
MSSASSRCRILLFFVSSVLPAVPLHHRAVPLHHAANWDGNDTTTSREQSLGFPNYECAACSPPPRFAVPLLALVAAVPPITT